MKRTQYPSSDRETMKTYLFEFLVDGQSTTDEVYAVDSYDAFTAFYANHPGVIVEMIWVKWAAA